MSSTNAPTEPFSSLSESPIKTPKKPQKPVSQRKSPRQLSRPISPDRPSKTPDYSYQEHTKTQSLTPRSSLTHDHIVKKPISLAILEKYFSDICQSITTKNLIDPALLGKAETMHGVLKDCLTAIHDLSLEIYILMASALKDIQHIRTTNDHRFHVVLMNKLLQISTMIEDNAYRSTKEKVSVFEEVQKEIQTEVQEEDVGQELFIRVSRVTARILNIWNKIVCPQKEAGIICCGFLLLYCEVDPTIKVSPLVRLKFDKAVSLIKKYIANPGYVVTVIRKTKDYIEKELISIETIRRIHDMLGRVTIEEIRNMDRTMTGYVLYELLVYAVKYYEKFAREKYNVEIYTKTSVEEKIKEPTLLEFNKDQNTSEIFQEFIVVENVTKPIAIENIAKPIVVENINKPKVVEKKNSIENPKLLAKIPGVYQSTNSGLILRADKVQLRTSISPNRNKASDTMYSSFKTSKNLSSQSSLKSDTKSPQKSSTSRPYHSPIRKSLITHSPSKTFTKPIENKIPKPSQTTFSPRKLVKSFVKSPSKSIDFTRASLGALNFQSPSKAPTRNSISPQRTRNSIDVPFSTDSVDHRDLLEEMQYQQFIEEKFRNFLVDKLNQLASMDESFENKLLSEDNAIKNREEWMKEFESRVGVIRFNAIKKLGDERRFTAELIRAQRQLVQLDTSHCNDPK